MDRYTELYNLMAIIINKILGSGVDPLCFQSYEKHEKAEEYYDEISKKSLEALQVIVAESTTWPSSVENMYNLLVILQYLDRIAFKAFDDYCQKRADNGDDCITFDSLNSDLNVEKSGIIIFLKIRSIWEGSSGERYHKRSLNAYLVNTAYITKEELQSARVPVVFHYIDKRLFDIKETDPEGYKYLRLAATPVSDDYKFKLDYHSKDDCKYFFVTELTSDFSGDYKKRILDIIRDADSSVDDNGRGVDILVFPEMLGDEKLFNYISKELSQNPAENVKLIVLPSIWKYDNEAEMGENYCNLVTCDGTVLFSQNKLARHLLEEKTENRKSIELIDPLKAIHILYANNVGAICILICVSELINKLRGFVIASLEVNLILSPSFANGDYEFRRSAMAGAEMDCNIVWSNTCSANDDLDDVCFITDYTKNRDSGIDSLSWNGKTLKGSRTCDHRCKKGKACLWYGDIKATHKGR